MAFSSSSSSRQSAQRGSTPACRNRVVLFLLSITAVVLVRNTFIMFSSDTILTDPSSSSGAGSSNVGAIPGDTAEAGGPVAPGIPGDGVGVQGGAIPAILVNSAGVRGGAAGSVPGAEETIRRFSSQDRSSQSAADLILSTTLNNTGGGAKKNDHPIIQLLEKNDKNHTLLKANMSHVGEIVKKLKKDGADDLLRQKESVVLGSATAPTLKPPVNPHPFRYVINAPTLCGSDSVFILVYIHTAPDHYKRRMIIRQTWGKVGQYREGGSKSGRAGEAGPGAMDVEPLRVVFVMGVTKVTSKLNETDEEKALFFESEQYGDIVQEDFLDSYHNLTYKGIAALKWISTYCRQAQFVLKTDDDIFVNTYTLIKHMRHLEKNPANTRGLLMCAVWYGMDVMRTGKWKVTKEEWPEDTYPTYCSGSAFILSTDVVFALHTVSYHVPFFWVDDFYITGLLPLRAGNITHRQFLSTFVLNGDRLEEMFTGPQWYSYIFSHVHNLNRIQAVWEKMTRLARGETSAEIRTALPGQLKYKIKEDGTV